MLRYFLVFIFILLLAFAGFLFYGSRGYLDASEKITVRNFSHQIKQYQQDDTLSVSTFNLGYLSGMTNNLPVDRTELLFSENLSKTIGLYHKYSSDFIGFQEIDVRSNRSFQMDQIDQLADALGFPLVYQSVNWDKNYVPFPYWPVNMQFGRMRSGQAVFGKFQLLDQSTITLSKPINASFLYNAFYLDRLLQVTQWRVGEDTLCLLSVHLEAFDKQTRNLQAQTVVKYYKKYAAQYPTLLIGDFNSRPSYVAKDDAMNVITNTNDMASAITRESYLFDSLGYFTFNTDSPYQMIDYILYNPSRIEMIHSEVLQESGQISDHFPVFMKFVLKD